MGCKKEFAVVAEAIRETKIVDMQYIEAKRCVHLCQVCLKYTSTPLLHFVVSSDTPKETFVCVVCVAEKLDPETLHLFRQLPTRNTCSLDSDEATLRMLEECHSVLNVDVMLARNRNPELHDILAKYATTDAKPVKR